MKRSRTSFIAIAGAAAALLITIPAFGQQEEDPESLLPPGFEDPGTLPPPEKNQAAGPTTPPPPPPPLAPGAPLTPDGEPAVEESADEDLELLPIDLISSGIELPDHARRPTDRVGPLTPDNWGLRENAFGAANGRF